MDSRSDDRTAEVRRPSAPYAPPALRDLGTLAEDTRGPVSGRLGDGISRNGPRTS
jgi:hypothetical protein